MERIQVRKTLAAQRFLSLRVPRWVLRLTAAVNLVEFSLEALLQSYYRFIEQADKSHLILNWFFISSVALPLWVIVELLLLIKDSTTQLTRTILLDAAFAFGWCLVFWGGILYAFTHYAVI